MTWDELGPGYLAARPELSRITGRLHMIWWARLSTWAQEQGVEFPELLEREHLERFHQTMLWTPHSQGRLYTPNSIGQALQMVRAVLRWGAQREGWAKDPCQGWLQPRAIQPPRRRLTRDEVQRLLATPRVDTPVGLRDRALLTMFYSLGLPRSTCVRLDLAQLDLPERNLAVGYRRLPLGALLESALDSYLQHGRPNLLRDAPETALFLAQTGNRLDLEGMRAVLQKTAHRAGLEPGLTTRMLAKSGVAHAEELSQRFLFPFFS